MIPIPSWLQRDTGAESDPVVIVSQKSNLAKFAVIGGAGIALLAPNRYKTLGLAAAVIGGILLVSQTPMVTVQK